MLLHFGYRSRGLVVVSIALVWLRHQAAKHSASHINLAAVVCMRLVHASGVPKAVCMMPLQDRRSLSFAKSASLYDVSGCDATGCIESCMFCE